VAQNEPIEAQFLACDWHKSNRDFFVPKMPTYKKWHSLNRNHWHYNSEITGTNRTELANAHRIELKGESLRKTRAKQKEIETLN
jgi:hypothetical protein